MNQVDCANCGHHFETETPQGGLTRCPKCNRANEVTFPKAIASKKQLSKEERPEPITPVKAENDAPSGLYEKIALLLDFSKLPWYFRWPLNLIKIIVIGFVGLFIIFIILQFKTGEFSLFGGRSDVDKADTTLAYLHCKDDVEKQLKAPSTAQFESYGESRISESDSRSFNIRSHVDAQNSFGVSLRKEWGCQATYLNGDPYQKNNWRITTVIY